MSKYEDNEIFYYCNYDEDEIKKIITIQKYFRNKKNTIIDLNDRLLDFYDYMFSITTRIDINHTLDIITQEKYIDLMSRVDGLLSTQYPVCPS